MPKSPLIAVYYSSLCVAECIVVGGENAVTLAIHCYSLYGSIMLSSVIAILINTF